MAGHIVDEQLGAPASYLTIRPGDRVYDLYGWAVGPVVEPRIVATRDEFFDGLVVDFRGRGLFVDAPEVRSIYDGVVVLALTVADLARNAPERHANDPASPEDAAALTSSLSRMYAADRMPLRALECATDLVLRARTRADLDAIAAALGATPQSQPRLVVSSTA